MTACIGVDFHARQQTISHLTTEGGEIQRLQLDHGKADEVRRSYGQFAGQRVVVGFESSGQAAWFEKLLEELGCEIWIGQETGVRPAIFAISDLIVRGCGPCGPLFPPTGRHQDLIGPKALTYHRRWFRKLRYVCHTLPFRSMY
jgi:hypothetical protein